MLLITTPQGQALETNALINGDALPKLSALIIDDGVLPNDSDDSSVEIIHEIYRTDAIAFERISEGVTKIYGEVPPDEEFRIRGIGLMMEDGTLYAYARYQPQVDGFFKGKGFAFSFFVLHSRENNTELTFTYSPLDITAIAEQIATEAKTGIDLYIQSYFTATTKLISGMNRDICKQQKILNKLTNALLLTDI
jgi:hypothetical protein